MYALALPFQMPLDRFGRVWEVLVDEVHCQFWPRGVVAIADGVDESCFCWDQRKVSRALERLNITFTVSSVAAWSVGDGIDVAGLRSSFHIPVCLQRSDSRTGLFVAVIVVV